MTTHNINHIRTVRIDEDLEIQVIPMFQDNYGYLIIDNATYHAAMVDPADHAVMLKALKLRPGVQLKQLWCTHKHADHCGGNEVFAAAFPGLEIYGPKHELVPAVSHPCEDGASFMLGSINVRVLHVPCHTRGHIAFFAERGSAHVLASGDCLFVGGCGRFFEGTPEEMLTIMDRFSQLPADTVVLPAHEYTLGNFQFNASVDPSLQATLEHVRGQRDRGEFTVPTTILAEKRHNVFMMTRTERMQGLVADAAHNPAAIGDPVKTMELLRTMKNSFKA